MTTTRLAVLNEPSGLGATTRRDAWWAGPLVTAVVLLTFVVYSTWRAVMNQHYLVEQDHLLSPMFSPLIRWEGMPAWLSPAFLILWAPGGFRVTCYYYRKAYYRSLLLDPPACAVGEPRHDYRGETRFPLILQNMHRYFMYLAVLFLFVLWYDAFHSMFPGGKFGFTVGTLMITLNSTLLTFYTFSCHSLRHLVGGKLDCFSCSAATRTRHGAWKSLTKLNENHMLYAWISLFGVMFADLYVWMVASGTISNARLF
jgi:hypothetical protein